MPFPPLASGISVPLAEREHRVVNRKTLERWRTVGIVMCGMAMAGFIAIFPQEAGGERVAHPPKPTWVEWVGDVSFVLLIVGLTLAICAGIRASKAP